MQIVGRKILAKLQYKNRGNTKLLRAINQFITDLENLQIDSFDELKMFRSDFEKVHNNGFYFADIHIHRVLLLIKITKSEVRIVWAGDHAEYVRTFKNNKDSIGKWIRNNNLI